MPKLGHDAEIEDEATFLQEYKKEKYKKPSVTTDIVIFTVLDAELKVLLIKRGGHPFKDCWAILGASWRSTTSLMTRVRTWSPVPTGSCWKRPAWT